MAFFPERPCIWSAGFVHRGRLRVSVVYFETGEFDSIRRLRSSFICWVVCWVVWVGGGSLHVWCVVGVIIIQKRFILMGESTS